MSLRSIGDVLYARKWVVVSVLILALLAAPLFLRMLRPTYQATAQVVLVGSPQSQNYVVQAEDIPDLAMSTEVLQRARTRAGVSDDIDTIRSKMSASMSPRSSVMPISYRDKSARKALAIPNALADSLVDEYHDLASRQYDQQIAKLRSQLSLEQSTIRELDVRLQQAVQKDSYAGQDNALTALSTRLNDLDSQRATANAQYVADRASANTQSAKGALGDVFREQALASDPYYGALRAGQAKDAAELAAERAGYTDAYPGLAGLKEKVSRETAQVDRASQAASSAHIGAGATYAQYTLGQRTAAAQVAGDQARLKAIDAEVSATLAHIRNLPQSGVATNALRLQRDAAAGAYQQVEIRLQNTIAEQTEAASLNSLVVLDHATSATPRIPTTMMALLLAVLILGLAIGSAYAAEAVDPRIRSRQAAEELYGTPNFGSVNG